jgi:crotonobetainyl-CoA:carnitine CoA-transferase CaiB-like acyl-CoA transferase
VLRGALIGVSSILSSREKSQTEKAPLPLSGIQVLEIGTSVAAPYAGWVLAALGANVTKIERPGRGDDIRYWGPPFWRETSTMFHTYNRGKRSLEVDLKNAGEVQQLRDWITRKADVVLQNLRPGVVERAGLDAVQLCQLNPRLVYCNVRAYGATGPLRDHPGYDPLMQAFAGLMSVTGEGEERPVRVGTSIIDKGTGLWCVIGILTMLEQRHRTGQGGVVDTALLETALAWMGFHVTDLQATGKIPVAQGSGVRGIAPYQAYLCSDGYLMVAAANDRLFAALVRALGHADWSNDSRFATNPDRYRNLDALNAIMGPIFLAEPRSLWQERLSAAGVPCAPLQTLDEVVVHPQVEALGLIEKFDDDDIPMVGVPLRFNDHRPSPAAGAPELGDYNAAFKRSSGEEIE